ncbi:hypothetical protein [Morganella morganii]|uniref:hypothetical protein n=1 Tax=Morganella morganii TaxID=582 RepID=UPI001D10B90C|nr:hypothetical protein [Morganella morganii]
MPGKKAAWAAGISNCFLPPVPGWGGTARALLMLACVSALVVSGLQYLRHRFIITAMRPRIIAFGPHLIAGMIMVME